MEEYLTEKQMAKLLNMSRNTLWEMRLLYGMPFLRINRMIRYNRKEVADWMRTHEINGRTK